MDNKKDDINMDKKETYRHVITTLINNIDDVTVLRRIYKLTQYLWREIKQITSMLVETNGG